jgi:hypothetical protein
MFESVALVNGVMTPLEAVDCTWTQSEYKQLKSIRQSGFYNKSKQDLIRI